MPPVVAQPVPPIDVVYPETDGAPIAESSLQYDWITLIKGGLDILYADDPNVLVAGDLFWYPVQGDPQTNLAPDAMVVFGRPKGPRGSYKQWEEGGVAPQVVFEVMSPSNRPAEMARKLLAYERFGVEEYYVLNPDPARFKFEAYVRQGDWLEEVPHVSGHVSRRLGIRFEVTGQTLRLIRPDGQPFASVIDIDRDRQAAREEARRAVERERTATERAEGTAARLRQIESFLRQKGIEPPPQ